MRKKFILIFLSLCISMVVVGQQLDLTNSNWLYVPPSGPDNYLIFTLEKVIYSQDFMNYYEGTWSNLNDTVFISFNFYKGKRGVGNINPASSTDYPSYLKHFPTINEISKKAKIRIATNDMIQFSWAGSQSSYTFRRVDKSEFRPDDLKISINGDYPEASIRIIPIEELKTYSKEELRLMRNEIFARYGYTFKSEDLDEHFRNQAWYKPEPAINQKVNSYLTVIEKNNIENIQKFE